MLSPTSLEDTLDWRPADDDVFVATVDGEYAGFVARTPRGHEAHSALGVDLGRYDTMQLATDAVTAAHAPSIGATHAVGDAPVSPRLGRGIHRPFRTLRNGTPGRSRGPKK